MSAAFVISKHIDKRIQQYEKAPGMWGSREAIELSILNMLEMELIAVNPWYLDKYPRCVLNAWNTAKSRFNTGPLPLFLFFIRQKDMRRVRCVILIAKDMMLQFLLLMW